MIIRLLIPLIFLMCFLSSFIAAGHGVGPMIYLLTQGSTDAWGTFQSFGYLGLVFFILGVFVFKNHHSKNLYCFISLILIYLSWISAVLKAGDISSQFILGAHFQIATMVWLFILHRSTKYKESLSINLVIWPLCLVSIIQLIDSLSWDIFEKSIVQVFGVEDEAYLLLSSINFASQFLWIIFFISVYFEFKKNQTENA